jgi:hypothetical protein
MLGTISEIIAFNGQHYSAHLTLVQYFIGQHIITTMDKAPVDRSDNGGICCADMLVLEGSGHYVDVGGLADHEVNQFRNFTAQALISAHEANTITTFHKLGLLGKGKSILLCIQLESHFPYQ